MVSKYKFCFKERPCTRCEKLFLPYQTKSGMWHKKVCMDCKKNICATLDRSKSKDTSHYQTLVRLKELKKE